MTIDPHSANWIDGWMTRDAENGVVQQEAAAAERVRVVEGLVATIQALDTLEDRNWIRRARVLAVVEAARDKDTTAKAQDGFSRQAKALAAACTPDTDDPPDFRAEDELDA